MVKEYKNIFIERKGGSIPELPFLNIKNIILSHKYSLNVIFCPPLLSKKLNWQYRNKDYPTNILSFPLSDTEGEIYIQLGTARKDAKKHNMSYNKFIHLLFIHGCLHLIHHDHGEEMEKLEDLYIEKFYKKNEAKNISKYNRN